MRTTATPNEQVNDPAAPIPDHTTETTPSKGKKPKAKETGDEPNPSDEKKWTKRRIAEVHLRTRLQFRYNTITGGIEWSSLSDTAWTDLDDYKLGSICREIEAKWNVPITKGPLLEYLRSDFSRLYHPMQEYFTELPPCSGTTTIDDLASTVSVDNRDVFRVALTRWMVAAVANVFADEGCQNQTCLVLTGGQGGFKTTWLNLLCPPSIPKYGFCGKIDLASKDTLTLLGISFIINLDDQLRELNKKDAETVKTLISHGSVTIRRPYAELFSYVPRMASFCASVNASEFLTDPTGSRRFLPFAVSEIDINRAQKIDINKAWAEAYNLYRQPDYVYWFTAQEIAEKFGDSEDFQVVTQEYELLHEYFEVVAKAEYANVRLNTAAIQSHLEEKSRLRVNRTKLSEALKKSNVINKSVHLGVEDGVRKTPKQWHLRERTPDEINQRNNPYSGDDQTTNETGF